MNFAFQAKTLFTARELGTQTRRPFREALHEVRMMCFAFGKPASKHEFNKALCSSMLAKQIFFY